MATTKLVLDAEIAQAIYQYLILTGLTSAANAFQHDCESRKVKLKRTLTANNKKRVEEYAVQKKKLLVHLERGESTQFLAIWNQLFPIITDNERDEAIDVLECYIRIYFATFPLRKSPPARNEYREKIADLKNYLEEGAGSKLSGTPELVQYFALPYVNEPGKHPVFKELVQKRWAKGILEKLERYLNRQTLNDGEAKLIKWMAAYYQYAEQQTQSKRGSSLLEAPHCSNRTVLEYCELQDDYYKLIDIAAELIDCLEQSCQGRTITAEYFADISSRLMESNTEAERRMQKSAAGSTKARVKRDRSLKVRVDNNNATVTSKKKETLAIRKSDSTGTLISAEQKATKSSNKVEEDMTTELITQLNYTKIANQLIKNTTSRLSVLLLHAIRQQLTRVGKDAAERSVEMFARKDILLLKHRRNSVLAAVVSQTETDSGAIKEELARLLNAFASFRIGRDYLMSINQGRELLMLVTAALKSKRLQHHASDHSLAVLQKLSVRSSVQKELIAQGMLEWLAYVLDSKVSAFALEYGCALLMNLCLNPASNSALTRVSIPLLNTISALLKSNNKEICKYINGVLYGIMCVGRLRARAKEMDLETRIKSKLDGAHCEDDMVQLPVLLKLFNSDSESLLKRRAAIADEDNEPKDDYLEAEIESTDSLRIAVNELFGVRLLETKFRLWNTNDNTSKSMTVGTLGRDEIAAPPGTVPRCAPHEHIIRKRVPTSITTANAKSGAAIHNEQQSLTLTNRLTSLSADSLLSGALPDRPTSISSQQTFILENDRRKPLVARNAFQLAAAFQQPSSNHVPLAKAKLYGKDNGCRTTTTPANRTMAILSRGTSEPRMLKQLTTEDSCLPRKTNPSSCKTSKSQTSINDDEEPLISSFSENFSDCIPYNTDTDEYVIAFGSRSKVPRTPTEKSDKKKSGEYCHTSRSVIDSY